jgi:hypothetical protein
MPADKKLCPGVCPEALEKELAPHPAPVRRSSLSILERKTSFDKMDVQTAIDKATTAYYDQLSPAALRKIEMDVSHGDTPKK